MLYLLWIGTLCGGNNSSEANQIKVDGIEMHTVGIQTKAEKDCSESEETELIKYSSSKDEYFYNTEDLGQFKNIYLEFL